MSERLDHGCAFEFDDLWRDVLLTQKPRGVSIFQPLDTHIAPLKAAGHDDGNDVFRLADIDLELSPLNLHDPEVENLDSSPARDTGTEDEFEQDLWSLSSGTEAGPELPKLFTWEGFTRENVPGAGRTALLSEAGPASFNAALNSAMSSKTATGLLPQDYTLRSYCNLVLGRGSSLFRWIDNEQRFSQTVDDITVSGVSVSCSASLTESFIVTGSTLQKLRLFVEQPASTRSSYAALLALKSCIASVLNAVEERTTRNVSAVHTILQLQSLVAPFGRLLSSLNTLMKDSRQCTTDESLISVVSDHVHYAALTEYDLCPVFRSLLARVSAPWLERVARDVGLASLDGIPRSSPDPREGEAGFVDSADHELIQQTAASVSLLRDIVPDHILLQDDSHGRPALPATLYHDRDGSILSPGRASYHEHERRAQISSSGAISRDLVSTERSATGEGMSNQSRVSQKEAAHEYLEDMNAIMSGEPVTSASTFLDTDELYDGVLALGLDQSQETSLYYEHLMADTRISPFEQIRPAVQRQHRTVNGILLRQLLKQHNLRQHLQLQRAFHLFGNAEFVDRLSTALFSSDVQSAERRRGTIPTGQLMGLRLGKTHEERWPPASSELRLTLTGILNETRHGPTLANVPPSSKTATLPGGLSFSIRELPEHEIDRVLDPNSIYALDFLRLQYTAEVPINAIITPEILRKYDDIFRFLVKILRLIHINANLTRQLKDDALSGPVRRFASHANHVVSILMSHVTAMGIDEPWATLMQHVRDLERTLSREDNGGTAGPNVTCSMESLRQAHDTCLERIRTRLFLKRRQERVRLAVENVLAAILETAFVLQSEPPAERDTINDQLRSFLNAANQLCPLLQEQIDRLPKPTTIADFEDADAHKILLARLNWNFYY